MRSSPVTLALAAVLLAGCAADPSPRPGRAAVASSCVPAQGEAVMSSLAASRAAARVSLVNNAADARGFIAARGLGPARLGRASVRCEPYRLWIGGLRLHRCLAAADLCARPR